MAVFICMVKTHCSNLAAMLLHHFYNLIIALQHTLPQAYFFIRGSSSYQSTCFQQYSCFEIIVFIWLQPLLISPLAKMLRVQKSQTCHSLMVPNHIQVLVGCDSHLSQQQILGFSCALYYLKTHNITHHMTSQKLLFRVTNWNEQLTL